MSEAVIVENKPKQKLDAKGRIILQENVPMIIQASIKVSRK